MKFILFLFLPLIGLGQNRFSGTIIDDNTRQGVPFATVGLLRENKGISANNQGEFSIYVSFPNADSFRISSVGYETVILPVSHWVDGQVVKLKKKSTVLRTIHISNLPGKSYTLNHFSHCSSNYFNTGLNTVFQMAQYFEAPDDGMRLTRLELCKDGSASIFRIRIYDYDTIKKCPSDDLADTVIEVNSDKAHLTVDLEKYYIMIPGRRFFIAVEWLFVPYNEATEKLKMNGKKISTTWYKPSLRFVYKRDPGSSKLWQMDFNGRWVFYPHYQNFNFQITPTLK